MNVPETRRILTLYQFYAKSMPYYFMFTFHISFYFLFSVPSFDELMQVWSFLPFLPNPLTF